MYRVIVTDCVKLWDLYARNIYIKRPTGALRLHGCNFIAQWSPTCFGSSCGHLQGGENKDTNCSRTFLVHTPSRAIAGLSYGRFQAIRHKFHCKLPSKEPLVIVRKGWIQRILSFTYRTEPIRACEVQRAIVYKILLKCILVLTTLQIQNMLVTTVQ